MEDILLNEMYDPNTIQRLCLLNHAFNDRYQTRATRLRLCREIEDEYFERRLYIVYESALNNSVLVMYTRKYNERRTTSSGNCLIVYQPSFRSFIHSRHAYINMLKF